MHLYTTCNSQVYDFMIRVNITTRQYQNQIQKQIQRLWLHVVNTHVSSNLRQGERNSF